MPIAKLNPADLLMTIDPVALGFSDTSELLQYSLPWIGQARAEMAARFGLGMDQPDYNLFVLGEVGSGRASLLHQAMQTVAASRAVPPDLCYLHNFDAPDSVLGLAQKTLQAYRRACQVAGHEKSVRKSSRGIRGTTA